MKRKLRNAIYCFTVCLAFQSQVIAQWCVPATIIPYSPAMPGITHVVIGTINRTSSDLENYPYNSYVNTGLSTDLIPGNTYSVSITHTIDGTICPDMNLRVWVDYNLDYSMDDVGETVISFDHHPAGTYTGSFTVPLTAAIGTSRMRVTAKMSNLGGHTLPTPCDFPNPDPLGYHGESEDYTVNILNTTGVNELKDAATYLSVFPSVITDRATISFQSEERITAMRLVNALGEVVWSADVNMETTGMKELTLDAAILSSIKPGVYFITAESKSRMPVKRVVIL